MVGHFRFGSRAIKGTKRWCHFGSFRFNKNIFLELSGNLCAMLGAFGATTDELVAHGNRRGCRHDPKASLQAQAPLQVWLSYKHLAPAGVVLQSPGTGILTCKMFNRESDAQKRF